MIFSALYWVSAGEIHEMPFYLVDGPLQERLLDSPAYSNCQLFNGDVKPPWWNIHQGILMKCRDILPALNSTRSQS
jgi:hypothetical protein